MSPVTVSPSPVPDMLIPLRATVEYVGTWKIEEGNLFLVSLHHEDFLDNPSQADKFNISLDKVNPEWSPPVKAVWFSGTIRIGRGKWLGGMGLGAVCEVDIFLEFKDGKLVSTRQVHHEFDDKHGKIVSEEALLSDGINQILGRIRPDMSEAEVEKIVKTYYPEAKETPGDWSGQTGYVDFKLTSRYSISIEEYNAPNDFNSRFVHARMILYVFDWELKRRIDISIHNWDGETKKSGGKPSEPKPEDDGLKPEP